MGFVLSQRMLFIKLQRNIGTVISVVVTALCTFALCQLWTSNLSHHSNGLRAERSVTKKDAFMVVTVLTGPRYFEQRDAIRQTWLSEKDPELLSYFVVGVKGLHLDELGALYHENSEHGDMLLLPDLRDAYENLTTKVIHTFKWVDENVNFQYLLKADDDTYARMDILLQELRAKKQQRLYWGFFDGRAKVKTRGQWAERKFKLCEHYLPHARGGGYILSADLVHYIAENSQYLQKFNSEDISVGTWLAPLDITRLHDPRFDTEYMSRGCLNEYIVTHKQNVERLRNLHKNLKTSNKLCSKEYKVKNSYIYNWDVPPSLCCLRNDSRVP